MRDPTALPIVWREQGGARRAYLDERRWGGPRRAALIPIGATRATTERLALGSVAKAALRDAPCNVLAVPPRAVALDQHAHGHAPAGQPAEAATLEPVPA